MTLSPKISRRSRKRDRTRSDLFRAAAELVREKGFEATTVEDITERADYALRTFFRHFRTREDVLFADHEDLLADLEELIDSAPEGESILSIARRAISRIIDRLEQDKEFALLRNDIAERERAVHAASLRSQHQWVRKMTAALARRMEVDPVADLRPSAVAALAGVAVYNAAFRWSRKGGELDLQVEAERNFDLIVSGLQP